MSNYTQIAGTTQLGFAFGGPTGPQIVNDAVSAPPTGALAAYDTTGQTYIPFRVGEAVGCDDAINQAVLECKLAEVASSLRDELGVRGTRRQGLFRVGGRRGLFR